MTYFDPAEMSLKPKKISQKQQQQQQQQKESKTVAWDDKIKTTFFIFIFKSKR